MPPAGGFHGGGTGGPGPGIHGGGGPRGGPPGGGHPGGRAGPNSRSGGLFSGMAHVGFGGQGILGHIFGTRATANIGTYYDSPEERYVAEYKNRRRNSSMSQNHQPNNPAQHDIPDYPQYLMNPNSYLADRYKTILVVLMASMTIVANVLGAQMWRLWIIPLDCGVFVYPIVYVCLDVLNEVYKRDIADQVVGLTCAVNLLTIAAIWIARLVLRYSSPGVDNTTVIAAYGFSIRVFIASTVAFSVSSVKINNFFYEKYRRGRRPHTIARSAFKSSFWSRALDSLLFTVIAFYGRAAWNLLLFQFFGSFTVACIIEGLCTPAKVKISKKLDAIVNG